MNDKAKTQKEKEEEASNTQPGIASGILGMASSIGGMIPSLLAGPQKRQLEQMQSGQGAGASVARQTASEAARRVTGASTAQPGSGRGGSLRAGLRQADEVVQRGAQQAARTAAMESLQATQLLRQNELARRQSFQQLGAGVGQGLAGIGGMLASARDQGDEQPDLAAMGEGAARNQALGLMESETGLGTPTTHEAQQAFQQDANGKLQHLGEMRAKSMPGGPTPDPTGKYAEPGAFTGEMTGAGLAEAEIESEEEVRRKQLKNLGAEKQAAAQQFIDATGTPTGQNASKMLGLGEQTALPPSMSDPESVGDFLYNEAANYNPAVQQGMDPQEVAKLLYKYNLVPIDWARLGIGEMSLEGEPPQ